MANKNDPFPPYLHLTSQSVFLCVSMTHLCLWGLELTHEQKLNSTSNKFLKDPTKTKLGITSPLSKTLFGAWCVLNGNKCKTSYGGLKIILNLFLKPLTFAALNICTYSKDALTLLHNFVYVKRSVHAIFVELFICKCKHIHTLQFVFH